MADHPDLLPSGAGINNLGTPIRPWGVVYANTLKSGTTTVDVNNIATVDNITPKTANALPVPYPGVDDGKIPIARGDNWVVSEYPTGGLPPVTAADNGKVLQVVGGKWTVMNAMALPPVDSTMDGSILRVVGGQYVVWKTGLNPQDMPNPCPVAPEEDGRVLISQSKEWVTQPLTEKLTVPPISASDIGKFLVVARDENSQLILKLAPPSTVTTTDPGCLPALPGDVKQYFNGAGSWSAVTASNNGQFKVGDLKLSLREPDSQWLTCDSTKSVGRAGSGATYQGNTYRAIYAILDGTANWETNWANNTVRYLPNKPGYQVMVLPEAQAPAEASIIVQATAGTQSHFTCQVARDITFQGTVYNLNSYPSPAGWYRLDGDYPELLSGVGNTFAEALSVLLDVTSNYQLQPGLWFYRVQQIFGPTANPTSKGRWQYGSFITAH